MNNNVTTPEKRKRNNLIKKEFAALYTDPKRIKKSWCLTQLSVKYGLGVTQIDAIVKGRLD
jgi:hypothetical protein